MIIWLMMGKIIWPMTGKTISRIIKIAFDHVASYIFETSRDSIQMSKYLRDTTSGGAFNFLTDFIVGVRSGTSAVLLAVGSAIMKNATNVSLPNVASVNGAIISGHVAVFSDNTGTIQDGGALAAIAFSGSYADLSGAPSIPSGQAAFKAVSDNTQTTVASLSGVFIAGHFAVFADNFGTLRDGGVLAAVAITGSYTDLTNKPVIPAGTAAFKAASDNSQSAVASVSGSFTIGHVALFSDINGTIHDGGLLANVAFSGAYADLTGLPSVVSTNMVNGYTAQQYAIEQTLAFGATVNWNLDAQQAAVIFPTGNFTLANPTNMRAGGTYSLRIKQDATGGRIITIGSAYKTPGGVGIVLSTAANAEDLMTCYTDGTNMYCQIQRNFA
jgi:hypothetical protein